MDVYELMHRIRDSHDEAKRKNVPFTFSMSQEEYDALFDWVVKHLPANTVGRFDVMPMFDGVPIRIV